jgi:hypothetical protein
MPATATDKPHAGRIAVVTGAARGIAEAGHPGLRRVASAGHLGG